MTGNRRLNVKMNKAFTVFELLVVMAMIGILSLVTIPSYKNAKDQLALERSAVQLAQSIRKAQEMAMSSREIGGTVPGGGYGIYSKKVPEGQISYILFADKNNNQKYDPGGEEIIEEIYFETGIEIKNLETNHVNIIFKPPDPNIYLRDNDNNDLSPQTAIEISLISDETKSKSIEINTVGLIDVD